jgi:YceI-like domain
MLASYLAPLLRIVTMPLSLGLLIASITYAQERPTAGQVNTEHSRVYIFVDKTGVVGHQHAIEGRLASGNLSLNGSGSGALVFHMKSFDADTPRARKYVGLEGTTDEATRKKVNENMLGVEILNVNKFGTAKFENAKIQPKNSTSKRQLPEYVLVGDFTLHEKTRRVEILCDLEVKDGWNHVRGGFKIRQSDYGIKPFSKMLGAVGVTDELTILGDLWVVPE